MSFSAILNERRRTIRAPVNPLDKATIVSILPKRIEEIKPTIQPGRFIIEAGSYDKPSSLIVGPSSWWREIDDEQPLLEIPNSAIQIADSVVKDYSNGLFACNMDDAMPGLFYISGSILVSEIKTKYKHLLDQALAKQRKWYEVIVRLTDILWARSNGNPIVIGDDARMAARELSLTKDWMADFLAIEKVKCIACGALRDPNFPICQVCKAIADPARAKLLGIEFAK